MKLTITCPHCDNTVLVNIENDKVVYVQIEGVESASYQEIKNILSSHNIEFG